LVENMQVPDIILLLLSWVQLWNFK
jgi:hypothetical protein